MKRKKDLVYGYIMLELELQELLEPRGQDWNKTQGAALKSEINILWKKVSAHRKSKFSASLMSYPSYISLLLPRWPLCDDSSWMPNPDGPVKAFTSVLHAELDCF